jgi:hypothetical protein
MAAPRPGQRTTPNTPQWQAVLDTRKKGHFTPNALLRRAGRALYGNPKKMDSVRLATHGSAISS